tara:strand:- start:72 stop:752 length:681 start_codon:yes stop_codon:yes gene_type:complete
MLAIIQARFSSKRLKGKVLRKINKKELLKRVFDRAAKSKKIKKIIVATSTHKSDDKIVKFCIKKKINYFRGDLHDVWFRFVKILKLNNENSFIRICADSPFIHNKLLDKGIEIFDKKNCDIVTNVFPRSYPKGQSIEIFKSSVLIKNYSKLRSNYFKEHFPKYFYKNYKKFKIKNFKYKSNFSHMNLSVDTKNDLMLANKLFKFINERKKFPNLDYLISRFNFLTR